MPSKHFYMPILIRAIRTIRLNCCLCFDLTTQCCDNRDNNREKLYQLICFTQLMFWWWKEKQNVVRNGPAEIFSSSSCLVYRQHFFIFIKIQHIRLCQEQNEKVLGLFPSLFQAFAQSNNLYQHGDIQFLTLLEDENKTESQGQILDRIFWGTRQRKNYQKHPKKKSYHKTKLVWNKFKIKNYSNKLRSLHSIKEHR